MALGEGTVVSRRADVISEAVFDDVVVLDPATSRYVRLNATAATLWEALAPSPATVTALADILVARLAAPPEAAVGDVLLFVEAMSSRDLVELSEPA